MVAFNSPPRTDAVPTVVAVLDGPLIYREKRDFHDLAFRRQPRRLARRAIRRLHNLDAKQCHAAVQGRHPIGIPRWPHERLRRMKPSPELLRDRLREIGRPSCRERVCKYVLVSVVAVSLKKKK